MHRTHALSITLLGLALLGCGGEDESDPGQGGGTGGAAGTSTGGVGGGAGAGGAAASGGTGAGGIGATGGVAGSGGTAGSGGAAGSGGTAGGATGGAAGASGGTGGAAGSGGTGGNTGGAGGTGGTTGGTGGTTGGTGGTGGGFAAACYTCHGTTGAATPAPPKDTTGATATSAKGVGSHQSHLASSNWHAPVTCEQCHLVPATIADPGHIDTSLPAEVIWDATDLAKADAANPSWGGTTCTGVYCHGSTLMGTGNKSPTWTTVDGTQKACGTACHGLPPGGTHPTSTTCPQCHGAVIASFTAGSTPTATWADSNKHINGTVEVAGGLTCTSCHGTASTNDPSPPLGSKGETLTSQPAVGAHQQHLASATWHKQVACTDCHTLPTSTSHSNGVDDFTWSSLATGGGTTTPSYSGTSFTCTGSYCHGSSLMGPNPGGSTKTSPVWTTVDGSFDACGSSCHTNPPGGTHPPKTQCSSCHAAVITTYSPTNPASNVWADAQKHVNGTVEQTMTCTSCHGSGNNPAPPVGYAGETATNTLAVGRHSAHLTASTSHVAFACGTCHTVPPAGNVAHAAQYVASTGLATPGHHGDVVFSAPATGMVWNVNATQGAPVTARGTCAGACHSDGRGGPPNVTPYWAGGTWNTGSCASCHDATMNNLTNKHPKHDGEGPCSMCHPPANSATHMNGSWTVNSTVNGPQGGSISTTPPGSGNPCGQNYACNGTCHGHSHTNDCWD